MDESDGCLGLDVAFGVKGDASGSNTNWSRLPLAIDSPPSGWFVVVEAFSIEPLRSSWGLRIGALDRISSSTIETCLCGGLACLPTASTERSRVRRWKYSLARRRVEEGRGCTVDTSASLVGSGNFVSPRGDNALAAD